MSAAALKEAVTRTAVAEKPKDFPAMLTVWLPEIRRALPKHLNADRMSRIALTAFRRTPQLGDCDPRSVFAAVIQASQLGLEPDTLGRSYLIPYKNNKKVNGKWVTTMECQFVPGWKGLVDLMNRSGQGTVYTGVIFKDQEYDYTDGSLRELKIHNETNLVDPADITHAFAIGHIKGGMFPVIELWRMAKVIKHRDRYNKVGDAHYSFGNMEMYARKVVLLQVLKYMPCSPELATAMALNDAAEIGAQKIDLKDAIEGTWEPAGDDPSLGDGDGGTTEGDNGGNTTSTVDKGTGEIKGGAGQVAGAGDGKADPWVKWKAKLAEAKNSEDLDFLRGTAKELTDTDNQLAAVEMLSRRAGEIAAGK